MTDQPGRKADLDKDGIVFADMGKAELDREGIALEGQESPPREEFPAVAAQPDPPVAGETPGLDRRKVYAAAGGAAGLLVLLVALGMFLVSGTPEEAPPRADGAVQPAKAALFGSDGMLLDPFMVFYDTRTPNRSGVLIAQVSLKVDPAVVPSVESRLYDIRRIIYQRLAAAASVYSQTEITLMLSDDLMDYPIQEVAFVQFNAR